MTDDELLRADAARWNARQRALPDLDVALDALEIHARPAGLGRVVLNALAASAVAAAAVGVVVISSYQGHGTKVASGGPSATPLIVTTIATVPAPALGPVVTRTIVVPHTITVTAHVTNTAGITRTTIAIATVTLIPTNTAQTTQTGLRTFDAQVEARAQPVFGHTRALLASLGMFIAIAGAWGIGRVQRRRLH
jgi:hypothetical protein